VNDNPRYQLLVLTMEREQQKIQGLRPGTKAHDDQLKRIEATKKRLDRYVRSLS